MAAHIWYLHPLRLQSDVTLVPNTVTGTYRRVGLEWPSWLALMAALMRLRTWASLSCSPLKATLLWKTLLQSDSFTWLRLGSGPGVEPVTVEPLSGVTVL